MNALEIDTETVEINRTTARRFFEELWNGRNIGIIPELTNPEFTIHYPLKSIVIKGYEEAESLVKSIMTAFPDRRMEVEDIIAERDRVVVRWTFTGTHKGEYMGIPPTGKKVREGGVSIYRFVDGKIAEAWVHEDALGLMQQLGVVPNIPA